MRRAFYGGAFDPFHVGHLHVVRSVAALGFQVMVAPAFRHPFAKKMVPFTDRCAMAALGISSVPNAEVIDIEMDNQSGTTLEVMRLVESRYPDDETFVVLGEADALHIADWQGGPELISKHPFLVIPRHPAITPPDAWYKVKPHYYLEALHKVDASSTNFKKLLATDPIAAMGMLDPFISAYIVSNDLYNNGN